MAKVTALVALLIALIAGASAYTTVVTTTAVEEENQQRQSCQREMQQMRMRHCMQWMQRGGYEGPFLRSAVANPRFQEEHLRECCGELRNFSPECRCEAIRRMMMEMQQEHGMQEEMQEMRQRAQELPRLCNMRSPSECRFRAVFV